MATSNLSISHCYLKYLLSLILSGMLLGCSHFIPQYRVKGGTHSLAQLQGMHAVRKQVSSKNLQAESFRDIALSLGAQAGLAFRAEQINQKLEEEKDSLDLAFNFYPLLLPRNILPPILIQAENALNLADNQTLRLADHIYKIVQQAKFVSIPPLWRDYLWMNYSFPTLPHGAFLPKNRTERILWKQAVTEGWHNGLLQANIIYSENLARLERDYGGIILYYELLAKGMIDKPYVAHTELGITGDQDEIKIRDQIIRITELPKLQPSSKWRAIISREQQQPLPPTQ